MIKIAFCDDDFYSLNEINALLDQYRSQFNCDIRYTAFQTPYELLSDIEKRIHYDILFLDIIMPEENGISLAQKIRQYDNAVKIIFLTSSAEFAVQSYTVGAYFYQLKPICAECFFKLMDSVIEDCKKTQQSNLIVPCKNGISQIDLDKLEYCEVIGRTLLFHMENGTVVESIGKLYDLRNILSSYKNFLQPHRSYLINMDYVRNISYKTITMDSQVEIPIPHGKCSKIKNLYLEYAFSRKQVLIS
ncbi:MAG: LytTR family DNA-binding domain-containing protein [Acetatifactor sp.]|nr:LytTR family DNA-binding domain-containing protein [Acetatifactor sp.]MDE7113078.1 LytTR family DNA-binding domain-containing protein [Acetatifactor sp.]